MEELIYTNFKQSKPEHNSQDRSDYIKGEIPQSSEESADETTPKADPSLTDDDDDEDGNDVSEYDDSDDNLDDIETAPEEHFNEEAQVESLESMDDKITKEGEVGVQPTLRRSKRTKKTTRNLTVLATSNFEEIPQTISELKLRDDWDSWKEAINDELGSMKANNTWVAVNSVPEGRKSINSKWVFTVKDDGRNKARLVAKGCSQRPGFDYLETFAPVVRMESVRTILALANEFGWLIHQMDVKTAFLNGDLNETIFMMLPNDELCRSQVVRLQKSLYGLKQASRAWNKKFDDEVKKLGFTQLKSDCCVYRSSTKQLGMVLYVDDILIIGEKESNINWIKNQLGRLFQMKDMKEIKHFLGMDISRNFQKQTLEISQVGYTEKILKRFGMSECNPIGTPLDPNVQWRETADDELTTHPFKELLGCLQYLAITSRPDICAAVSALSKYQAAPSDLHWAGLKRILRYLQGTIETKIVYEKKRDHHIMLGYADADFANDKDNRKSVSGYALVVFGNLVAWSTKRQPTVSLSSTEAELISLCTAAKEGLWLTNLLNELSVANTSFMEDNIPCIRIAEEPRSHQRMKHLDLKYLFIRELIAEGKLQLRHISTNDQPADAFTKGLPKLQHRKLMNLLNVRIEGRC